MKTNAIPWIIFFLLIFLVVNFYVLSGKRGIEISYSKFMALLKEKNILLNRKILAELAEFYPEIFKKIFEEAKK